MLPLDLVTDRLLLRRPAEADEAQIAHLCQDEAIAEFTTVPNPYTREDAETFVRTVIPEGWAAGSTCTWGIRSRDSTDVVIGMIGLDDIHDGSAELGFWLGSEYRGRQIMVEAANRVLDFAFDAAEGLGLRRVAWNALSTNGPSARVAQKIGMRWEGLARSEVVHRGLARDVSHAALLSSDARGPAPDWPADA